MQAEEEEEGAAAAAGEADPAPDGGDEADLSPGAASDDESPPPGSPPPPAVHPNAFTHLLRAEQRGRCDCERKEVKQLYKLNESILELVERWLVGIEKSKAAAVQKQRALESDRKRLSNEQMRHRSRIEDDWLRGFEHLLYIDFIEGARRIRQRALQPPGGYGSARPAHGAGHYAVAQLQNYPRSRTMQQSLFR
eukprot:TRINITY_DN9457_c0_g4_i1.p1 TRINITY_DN9457_c0_g4~~TRINITY_DN9457_c0_g4_i1.p1  ORF type:complete len:194 (+),score=67.42 TRINITY_DN9457_c0_g4_i1:94-675(+)